MKGNAAPIGAERTSQNGYQYRKTEQGWELVHRIIAEEKLGRKLTGNEYATFIDGNKTNLDPSNVIVRIRGRASIRRRLAQVEVRIQELTSLRDDIKDRMDRQEVLDSPSS